MSFQGKYQILSALSDDESQSFRALQISSGRPVLLHHLAAGRTPAGQPDLASLIFKFLRSASVEEGRHLLDMGEDEGRIFVVTADVPECLDLRKWLQSVTGAHAQNEEEDAQPAGEGMPDSGNLDFTRTFTTEALRQISRLLTNSSAPPPPGPSAAPPAPTPKKSPGVLIPPAKIHAALSEVTDSGSPDFTAFWEKYYPASPAGPPASNSAPAVSQKSSDGPSEAPEVTAEFLTQRPSSSVHVTPTAAVTSLRAQAADRERSAAPVTELAEAKGNAGQSADLAPTPPVVMNPPLAPGKAEISTFPPPPEAPSAATGPATRIPMALAELLAENGKAPTQASAPPPTLNTKDKQDAGGGLADQGPRRQIPTGFEVVFQSSKPRSRSTMTGLPDQSGIMAAPVASAPQTGPQESVATPAEAGWPNVVRQVASPMAEKIGGSPAMGSLNAPGEQRQAIGTGKEPTAPPSPPLGHKVPNESEPATRLVSAPPVMPAKPSSQSPQGAPVSTSGAAPTLPPLSPQAPKGPEQPARMFSASRVLPTVPAPPAPPVSAPTPTPANRAQPGEYTRMVDNVRALTGPLPPVGTLGAPPAGHRPAANPAVPAPLLAQVAYPNVLAPQSPSYPQAPPQFQPSLYIANDMPAHSAGRKRKVWVPILILSGLFLMTVALLLFFALKH